MKTETGRDVPWLNGLGPLSNRKNRRTKSWSRVRSPKKVVGKLGVVFRVIGGCPVLLRVP